MEKHVMELDTFIPNISIDVGVLYCRLAWYTSQKEHLFSSSPTLLGHSPEFLYPTRPFRATRISPNYKRAVVRAKRLWVLFTMYGVPELRPYRRHWFATGNETIDPTAQYLLMNNIYIKAAPLLQHLIDTKSVEVNKHFTELSRQLKLHRRSLEDNSRGNDR